MYSERCPTGIEGFDELIEGGFPRGRVILLAGNCGTGKSIFAAQFLYNGAVLYNEPGILVCTEQTPKMLKIDLAHIGIDLQTLEDEKKLIIIDSSLAGSASHIGSIFKSAKSKYDLTPEEFNIDRIIGAISDAATEIKAKRAVVDSFSALDTLIECKKSQFGTETKEDVRRVMMAINYKLQSMGLTSILITDIAEGDKLSKHGIEEFMSDGVITLHYNAVGPDAGRHLIIRKMRCTKHSENIHTIEFVHGKGIKIKAW